MELPEKVKSWFDVWKFVLVILVGTLVLWADSRYITRKEADDRQQTHDSLRIGDLQRVEDMFKDRDGRIQVNTNAVYKVDSRLSRIEAQNDMILKYLEAQQSNK